MKKVKWIVFCVVMCALALAICLIIFFRQTNEETRAREYLNRINDEINEQNSKQAQAEWNFNTNITKHNEEIKDAVAVESAKFTRQIAKEALKFDYKSFKDEDLKRQFSKLSNLGYAALPDDKFKELNDALNAMQSNYAKVHICSYRDRTKCDLQLEPELTEILQKSDDPDELRYYWTQWYDLAGKPTRQHFDTYLRLVKESANLNNFTSGAESWLDEYEDPTIEQQMVEIFKEIRPLYQQIHAYVRHALRQKYGELVPTKGLIPMHILGNMWGQTWSDGSLYESTTPYPKKRSTDVTDEMIRQHFTPQKIFQLSEQFYKSLNMSALPQTFWERSLLEKPNDGRELICHASAWDFFNDTDVRISQCTRINMDDLRVAFHEMGHVYYFLLYKDQPSVYREGANPGFHEAVGDTFALSASTPKHLEKLGLLKNYEYDAEAKINELYKMALEKIVFLPFAYSLDQYRWALFRGQVKPDEYNCRFWQMREEASGIAPPVQRFKEDFDPPAKYHVSADVEYLRYVVSFIVQFQFHKGACIAAGEYNPNDPNSMLSDCDIYGSAAAGNKLKQMLSLGSSKPWPDAMEILTGERKMSASALVEYFKPLLDWLQKKNKETGAYIGWDNEFKCLSKLNG